MSEKTRHNLKGRDLLLSVLQHEQSPVVPWLPYTGVHAAVMKGFTATEVLTDAEKLCDSLIAARERYDPDGMPVIFDLQIEAEILGCELLWADKNPPSVSSHPLADDYEVPSKIIQPTDGRLPVVLKAMRRLKKEIGETTALYGLACGPLTLASHLRGTELFMDMIRNPESLHDLINYCGQTAIRISEFYFQAGMDVIAIVDPLISQISPKHFNQFFAEAYTDIYNWLRAENVFSSFFVCGNASKNIEVMCQTGPDSIAVDENINMLAAKEITDRYNITITGNIPLTTKMLMGTPEENIKFVIDLLDQIDHHNFILALGCDLPYDVPVENVVAVAQALRDPEGTRKSIG